MPKHPLSPCVSQKLGQAPKMQELSMGCPPQHVPNCTEGEKGLEHGAHPCIAGAAGKLQYPGKLDAGHMRRIKCLAYVSWLQVYLHILRARELAI